MSGLTGSLDFGDSFGDYGSYDNYGSDWSTADTSYSSPFSEDWQFTNPNSYIGLGGNFANTNTINPDSIGIGSDDFFNQIYNQNINNEFPEVGLRQLANGNQSGLGGGSALTSNPGMSASTGSFIQQMLQNPDKWMKGLGALFEGNQNKKYASRLNQIAQNPAMDPFGSQRGFYQDQLKSAVQNPMAAPIVAAQLKGIQEAQNRKDAAAGRRSNVVGSAPAVMQAQGQVMQNYMNSLMQPAGAGIAPNSSALANLMSGAAKANTNGYASPIFSAYGQMSQDDILRALIAKL